MRILWGILVFFLAIIIFALIIAFFFFLGCPYEFVKCYLNRNEKSIDDDDEDYDIEENNNNKNIENEEDKPLRPIDYLIIFILIMLGICLQPVYLMFYILMAVMELYRQCGCWIFWAYHH